MANNAYERILLDDDLGVMTINKFLAAMQLVEGYSSELHVDNKEKQAFEKDKTKMIEKCQNEDDKNFLDKHCKYSGEIFRKLLKQFTFCSLNILEPQSKTQFKKNMIICLER